MSLSRARLCLIAAALLVGGSSFGLGAHAGAQSGGLFSPFEAASAPVGSDENRLVEAERDAGRLKTEVEALTTRSDDVVSRLRVRTKTLHRLARAGFLPAADGVSAMMGHMARVSRMRRMVAQDGRLYASLQRRLHALQGELEAADEAVSILKRAAATASTANAQLSAGLAPASQPGFQHGSFHVSGEESLWAQRFLQQRGRLGLPIAGVVDITPDERAGAQGITFRVQSGTAVRSVETGRVAFVGALPAFGTMLIVHHGEDYYSVYAGLHAALGVGARVDRGARLGDVQDPRGLFFQVRRGSRAQDARGWLGI